jgi:hypothetical protein
VRSLLTERYQVPGDVVHVRRWSLCTLAEVRGIRALSRRRGFERVVAVTHGYHARRVAKYLGEVALRGEVLSVDPETLARLPVPAAGAELWQMIAEAVTAARIGFGHHVRERATGLSDGAPSPRSARSHRAVARQAGVLSFAPMSYRAVIFDIGGVIVGSPLHAIAYEREAGIPAGPSTHRGRHRYDRRVVATGTGRARPAALLSRLRA